VIVFRPPAEAGIPGGSYRTATDISARLEAEGRLDPYSVQRIREYFRLVFQTVELDARGIQDSRKQLDYPQVARDFRMIDDDSISVVVEWGDESAQREVAGILGRLRLGSSSERHLLRRLQPYLVALPAREEKGLVAKGYMTPIVPGLWEWLGEYDEVRGLIKGGFSAEALIA
jgi:CRISPR-associated endonuclease/helicase Cas3